MTHPVLYTCAYLSGTSSQQIKSLWISSVEICDSHCTQRHHGNQTQIQAEICMSYQTAHHSLKHLSKSVSSNHVCLIIISKKYATLECIFTQRDKDKSNILYVWSQYNWKYVWKEEVNESMNLTFFPQNVCNLLSLCFYAQKLPWDCGEPTGVSDQYYRARLRAEQWPGKSTETLTPRWGYSEMCPINDHISWTASHSTLLWLN